MLMRLLCVCVCMHTYEGQSEYVYACVVAIVFAGADTLISPPYLPSLHLSPSPSSLFPPSPPSRSSSTPSGLCATAGNGGVHPPEGEAQAGGITQEARVCGWGFVDRSVTVSQRG